MENQANPTESILIWSAASILLISFYCFLKISLAKAKKYIILTPLFHHNLKHQKMFTLKDDAVLPLLFAISTPNDDAGNPTTLTDIVASSSDETVVVASINEAGQLSVAKTESSKLGSATVTVTGKDADGNPLTTSINVEVIAEDAKAILLTPVEAPVAAPAAEVPTETPTPVADVPAEAAPVAETPTADALAETPAV